VVAQREALLEMGGFLPQLRWHSDWFSYWAIALRYGACSIPETLAMMRARTSTYSSAGMSVATDQNAVITAVFDTLKRSENRDLLSIFRKCPALLSPFGAPMVVASFRRLRHWDIGAALLLWYGKAQLASLYAHSRHFAYWQIYCRLTGKKRRGK